MSCGEEMNLNGVLNKYANHFAFLVLLHSVFSINQIATMPSLLEKRR